MSTSAIYRTWMNRIHSEVFTKAECNTFAQHAFRLLDNGDRRGRRSNLTVSEMEALYDELNEVGVRLTPEHTEQGKAWLRNYGAKTLGITQMMAESVKSFTYHGDQVDGRPVYRAHMGEIGEDDHTFCYFNVAWASAQNLTEEQKRGWWWLNDEKEWKR